MIWKDIKGYDGIYQISNQGFVRSLPRKGRTEVKILKMHSNVWGYSYIGLNKKIYPVAHLVANAFLGPRPKLSVINHKDGNKLNNSIRNLEYVDPVDNYKHAIKNGLIRKKRSGSIKGKEWLIKILLKEGFPYHKIAALFDVHFRTILRFKKKQGGSK